MHERVVGVGVCEKNSPTQGSPYLAWNRIRRRHTFLCIIGVAPGMVFIFCDWPCRLLDPTQFIFAPCPPCLRCALGLSCTCASYGVAQVDATGEIAAGHSSREQGTDALHLARGTGTYAVLCCRAIRAVFFQQQTVTKLTCTGF